MSKYPNAQFISSANAIDQFVPDQGTEVASEHYGAKGWVFHQNTDDLIIFLAFKVI